MREASAAGSEGLNGRIRGLALVHVFCLVGFMRPGGFAGDNPATVPPPTTQAEALPVAVGLYERWEAVFPDAAVRGDGRSTRTELNPVDPAQVRLDMRLTTPDGQSTTLPGYFDAPCRRVLLAGEWRAEESTDPEHGLVLGDLPGNPDAPAIPASAGDSGDSGDSGDNSPRAEYWLPDGPPVWRLRYLPTVPGRYAYRIHRTLADREEKLLAEGEFIVARSAPSAPSSPSASTSAFTNVSANVDGDAAFGAAASASTRRGLLRRHPERVNRFRFDDGSAIFLIGHNLAWTGRAEVVGGFERHFDRLAQAGANFARVWNCTWSLSVETRRPLAYDLRRAAQLDAVLQAAEKRGLLVMLCLDNYHDFQYNWEAESPYARVNGGPCANRADFFSNPKARAQYRARLRYLAARYGAYSSLMAWELWNEQNYALTSRMVAQPRLPFRYEDGPAPGSAAAARLLEGEERPDLARDDHHLPWTRWAAAELKNLDAAHGHPVTTSLGRFGHWPGLWRLPEIDLAQYHAYIAADDWARTPLEQDGAAFVAEAQRGIAGYGKPALIGEFGYMGEGESSAAAAADPQGVLLHNSLWAGLMSGSAGTPMWWWWDNYIEPRGLHSHYRVLADFLDGVDWNDSFAPLVGDGRGLRAWSLASRRRVFLWLQNPAGTWYARLRNAASGRARAPTHAATDADASAAAGGSRRAVLASRGVEPGLWRVEWIDTWTGAVVSTQTTTVDSDGRLVWQSPPFRHDIAARAGRTD